MVYNQQNELVPGPPKSFSTTIRTVAKTTLTSKQKRRLNLDISVTEQDPLLDSCNIGFREWKSITSEIFDDCTADAFVVVHGTDTMAYTSSALAFMLHNFPKPVVITGSQIPMVTAQSDGFTNLQGAFRSVRMMALKQVSGVAVYFGDMLMKGVTVTKASAVKMEAFDDPGCSPYAIAFFKPELSSSFTSGTQKLMSIADDVANFAITPDFSLDILKASLQKSRGLLLVTYGANNVPSNRPDMIDILADYISRGNLVVSLSHVYDKARTFSEYETGNVMHRIGVVNGSAMTFEAAIIKMRWLLATSLTPQQRQVAMQCDFLGEYPSKHINPEICADLWRKV